jgi:hypothetical protein
MSYLLHLITARSNHFNSGFKLPWHIEVCGPKRIKKGQWIYPVRLTKYAKDYLKLQPVFTQMHRFLRFYSEPRNRAEFI